MIRLLVLTMWLAGVFLAARFIPNWQLEKSYKDLLPDSAKQVLAQQQPLTVDVFALPGSSAARLVDNFMKPLVASGLNEVKLNYIDPGQNPELVQLHQINKLGEMVIHAGESKFHLSTLSYEAFFNGLKKMNRPLNQWVVFLDNLGGKSFSPGQSGSYSDWLSALKATNYPAIALPWKQGLNLPKQAKLIVLSSPTVSLNTQQISWLEAQIKAGISVLWLADPQSSALQPGLSLLFDVMRTSAFHQGHLIIKQFPEHVINHNFDRPLDLVEVMPFETANKPLWINDQNQTIAATHEIGNSRMLVVGDSDFLANQYIHSGGNLEMSFRLIDWLLHHHNRIDLPSIGLDQTQLFFSQSEVLIFAGVMLLLIPLLFMAFGVYYWRKNKRV